MHTFGAVVVVALLVVFYFAAYRPILAARAALDARIQSNQERLAAAAHTREQHDSLNDRLKESEELAEQVRRRIPQQPQTPQFLGSITEMAEGQGMAIRDFVVGDVFERETHHEVAVQFASAGDYPAVCRFLDQLMTMPRVVTVERLTVDGEHESGSHQIQLSLLLPFGIKSVEPEPEAEAGG